MKRLRLRCVLLTLILMPCQLATASESDVPGFLKALEKGRKELTKKRYDKAASAFEQANALAGGSCSECLQGLGIAARRGRDLGRALFA